MNLEDYVSRMPAPSEEYLELEGLNLQSDGNLSSRCGDEEENDGPAPRMLEDDEDEEEESKRKYVTKELMMRVTAEARKTTPFKNYFDRITHLHLNKMRLDRLVPKYPELNDQNEPLPPAIARVGGSLTTLYLHDNRLLSLDGIECTPKLTHLYVQRNELEVLTPQLTQLTGLQKLYLDGNSISLIENMPSSRQLQELHVNSQRLPLSKQIDFSDQALAALAPCLRVLQISNNNIVDPSPIKFLFALQRLNISLNRIDDMNLVLDLTCELRCLEELDAKDNPVTRTPKYRDYLIVSSRSLQKIDGKAVSPQQRQFLVRLREQKMTKRAKQASRRASRGSAIAEADTMPHESSQPSGSRPGSGLQQRNERELSSSRLQLRSRSSVDLGAGGKDSGRVSSGGNSAAGGSQYNPVRSHSHKGHSRQQQQSPVAHSQPSRRQSNTHKNSFSSRFQPRKQQQVLPSVAPGISDVYSKPPSRSHEERMRDTAISSNNRMVGVAQGGYYSKRTGARHMPAGSTLRYFGKDNVRSGGREALGEVGSSFGGLANVSAGQSRFGGGHSGYTSNMSTLSGASMNFGRAGDNGARGVGRRHVQPAVGGYSDGFQYSVKAMNNRR